jgi:hypothetical protein
MVSMLGRRWPWHVQVLVVADGASFPQSACRPLVGLACYTFRGIIRVPLQWGSGGLVAGFVAGSCMYAVPHECWLTFVLRTRG